MTNEELAEVDELVGRLLYENYNWQNGACVEAATALQSLAAQLAEARDKALEEAAKVADGYAAAGKDNPQLAPISAQMRYCAQRIRALKGSQQ